MLSVQGIKNGGRVLGKVERKEDWPVRLLQEEVQARMVQEE